MSIDNKREICEYARQRPTLSLVKKIPCVQLKEAKRGLETAIRYIEQQSDGIGIDFSDLRIFRKYLNLLGLKELESKCQQKIDNYFMRQL